MSEVNLEEGKISFKGDWLSKEDINAKIQEQIAAGNFKFADLAEALEKLTVALENSYPLEIRIVLPKPDHEKLLALGGSDDKECIRKAIQAYIGSTDQSDTEAALEEEAETVSCPKCNTVIKIPADDQATELECPFCGTSVLVESETDAGESPPPSDMPPEEETPPSAEEEPGEPRHKDHFIG